MLEPIIESHLRAYFAAHADMGMPPDTYARLMAVMERPLLRVALESTGGSQMRAAAALGVHRNSLRRKLENLGMRAGSDGRA